MTDQLDDLFRDLRAETLTTVRPPGTGAARRTLRRRRRNRAAGAAACLAVAGVGGVGAHLLGPVGEPEVGDRPDQAAAAVGPAVGARFSGHGAATSAVVASGLVLAGHYTIALSCLGPGRVTLTVRVGDAEMGSTSARCGDGRVSRAVFTLPDTLTATAELSADDGADGRAGYAYAMTMRDEDRERLARDATGTLPAGPLDPVVKEWSAPSDGLQAHDATLDAGGYRVFYTCAGTGHIELTIRTPDAESNLVMDCEPPLRADAEFVTMTGRETLSVRLAPDAEADRQSAYAVRLERY